MTGVFLTSASKRLVAAISLPSSLDDATALIGHDPGLGAPSILGAALRARIWGLAYWILLGLRGLAYWNLSGLRLPRPREPSTDSTPNPKSLIP